MDFDGVIRRQPSNVTGFDCKAFNEAFKVNVVPGIPARRLTKMCKRFGEQAAEAAEIIRRLLPYPLSKRQRTSRLGQKPRKASSQQPKKA